MDSFCSDKKNTSEMKSHSKEKKKKKKGQILKISFK